MKFRLVQKIIKRMERGYSPVTLLVGPPNSGKTVLGAMMCEPIHWHFHKEKWDPKKYVSFDMGQLSEKILNTKKSAILIAEAGYGLSSDAYFSPHNRFFDFILQTQRTLGNCYFLNLPHAKGLCSRHRRQIDYIIKVKKHGSCIWKVPRYKHDQLTGEDKKPLFKGRYSGYKMESLACRKELKELDEANKAAILAKLQEKFEIEKVKTEPKKQYEHTCPGCKHKWISDVQYPDQCPKGRCRKRLHYVFDEQPEDI